MARNPKPDALKKLQGTNRLDRMNFDQPKFLVLSEDTQPPANLSKAAKQVWFDIVPTMARAGLATAADVTSLCMLCSELSAYWQYGRRIDKLPIQSKERYKLEQLKQMKFKSAEKLMLQFAMTPVARQRLSMSQQMSGYNLGDAIPMKPK